VRLDPTSQASPKNPRSMSGQLGKMALPSAGPFWTRFSAQTRFLGTVVQRLTQAARGVLVLVGGSEQ
jgi:hypothetical protein